MTSGSDSILAISQNFGPDSKIKGLKEVNNNTINSNSNSSSPENSIVWKDLGQYLETLNEIPIENTQLKNNLNLNQPLNTVLNYRICNICNRPILIHHLSKHIKSCLEMKQKKDQFQQDQQNKPLSGTATPQDTPTPKSNSNNKKRKLQDSIREQTPNDIDQNTTTATTSQPKTKKSKKEPTASKPKKKTTSRQKGPVDVERQCGVALPNGGFCARSLTCKTHSMGAKRAVPGRSASYDTLLAAYQHKNQVKIAGQAAKAQAEKDELIHGGPVALDSDEETQQVLSGVSRSFPLPLERKNLVPTRIRSNFLRMREMFAGAILPRITNSNGVGGINGRTALLDIDRSNEHLFLVRAPQRIMLNKNNIQAQQAQQAQAQQVSSAAASPQAAALAQNRNQLLAQQQQQAAAVAARQQQLQALQIQQAQAAKRQQTTQQSQQQ